MKILKLTLKGCHRLELSGIRKITITPDTNVLMILGTNGSGKSSLMDLLSPLPADKNDFDKDGYKEIELLHNDVKYTLRSDFKEGKHSFFNHLTNEELNIGGTITQQTQLVKDYFNYTDKIHRLLTGKDKFTDMSPLKRKEWFTLLCDTDYTYAISVYNKVKEKKRDIEGALKKLKQYLVVLNNQEQEEDIAYINQTIKEKESLIEYLKDTFPMKDGYADIDYQQSLKDRVVRANRDMDTKRKVMLKSVHEVRLREITSEVYTKAKDEIQSLQTRHDQLEGQYQALINQYQEMDVRVAKMKTVTQEDILKLKDEIDNVNKRIQSRKDALSNKSVPYPLDQAETRYNTYLGASSAISDTVDDIYDLDPTTSGERLDQLTHQHRELGVKLNTYDTKIAKVEEAIRLMEEKEAKEKVSCPNCNHAFHPGFNQEMYTKYQEGLANLRKNRGLCQADYDKLTVLVDRINHDYTRLKMFADLGRSYPLFMADIVRDAIKDKVYFTSPGTIKAKIVEYSALLENQCQLDRDTKTLEDLEKRYSELVNIDNEHKGALIEALFKLEGKITQMKVEKSHLESALIKCSDIIRLYETYIDSKGQLEHALKVYDEADLAYIEHQFYLYAMSLIQEERQVMSNLTQKQLAYLNRESNRNSFVKQIEALEHDLLVHEAMETALNPQDGLIAEGLLGFIKRFIAKMNGLIATIWTYPLLIHPSKFNDGESTDELSYRFPITVGMNKRVGKDASLGSEGIKEVIDLAFKMIAMHSLGLKGYPLYLDEFGRTFDAKHRENALKLIERLAQEYVEDQIFMVSHYYMEYSVIQGVSYCVLSDENIVLTQGVNNPNIVIER